MRRKTSIGIIGTGWVGSSVAISTLHSAGPEHLLLCDRREALAEGEAMDLSHGSSFYPNAIVESAGLERMLETDVVVIAAGRGGGPDESRLDLLRDNAAIVTELAHTFRSYEGTVVIVTNPVDALTLVFQRVSRMPPERVIGTGTMLDTSRLRQVLGRELEIDPRSVHAQVIGEHGDSEVFLWSSATVGGTLIRDWSGWDRGREVAIEDEVRSAAYRIIQRKGSTNHAIGLVTANLLRGMIRNERRVLTVSRAQRGRRGMDDIALSLPAIVGFDGATEVIEPRLDDIETEALGHSAEVIRDALGSLESETWAKDG
jgi:L-lactate dehydrogenase